MHVSVFIMAVCQFGAAPIDVYDLTYALQFDASNPARVTRTWDHCHAVAAVQGIVNRESPRLYVRFVQAHGQNIDDYWLGRLREKGQWLSRRSIQPVPDLPALIDRYRGEIKGVVVYDPNVPATSNLASTIAGVENLLPVRYDPSPESLYTALVEAGPRLPVKSRLLNADGSSMFTGTGTIPGTDRPSSGSAKCDAYLWLKHHYIDTGKVDAGFAGYYIDAFWLKNPTGANPNQHTLTNHDYFISKRGFFFDLSCWGDETPVDDPDQPKGSDLETLKSLLLSAYKQAGRERMIHIGGFTPWAYKYTNHGMAGGTHDTVPTEWQTVKIISAYNGFIDADAIDFAAMANASFHQHFPLKQRYPQRWTDQRSLTRQHYLDQGGSLRLDDREFMIFYVGDYDCAPWVYQWTPAVWDNPARGKLPLMWCVSPVLERRAPMVLDYMRRTATENDFFAGSDNGAGYLTPGMLQEPREYSGLPSGLDAWSNHCKPLYDRWDLTITGFIIDGYAPGLNATGFDCYAKFSPNGIVPQKSPDALLHGEMPVLHFDHDLPHDPRKAAERIIERVRTRQVPFNWFRAILKSPDWYAQVMQHVKEINPKIELLPAPEFFELLRIYLKNNPDAAEGRIEWR